MQSNLSSAAGRLPGAIDTPTAGLPNLRDPMVRAQPFVAIALAFAIREQNQARTLAAAGSERATRVPELAW